MKATVLSRPQLSNPRFEEIVLYRHARPLHAPVAGLVAAAALLVPGGAAEADDRDLLRTAEEAPYVFVVLDTSASMNAAIDGRPLPANGDDPRSRIFVAKKALYEAFENAGDLHLGFAAYNQDGLRVDAKHWLYRPAAAPGWAAAVDYPRLDDLWVFGPSFTDPGGAPIDRAGSCEAPLDLGDAGDRERLNRLSRGGALTLWLRDGGDDYRLSVRPLSGAAVPPAELAVDLALDRVGGACGEASFTAVGAERLVFRRAGEFLHVEAAAGEPVAGFWPHADATAAADCGDGTPFSGKGWEGNYDGDRFQEAASGRPVERRDPRLAAVLAEATDAHCAGGACYDLRHRPTLLRDEGRAADLGDLVPFAWDDGRHAEILSRLNPNHGTGLPPDFGVAGYFADRPSGEPPVLRLVDEARRPLVAAGASPLAQAVHDFRCWYAENAGSCRAARYPQPWERLARHQIGNEAGCIRPHLIVVTDGGNGCGGESPAADLADLLAHAGVRTWVIALAPEGSLDPALAEAVTGAGRGELVYAESAADLGQRLLQVRGQIDEQARSFATAAVPTVQAAADDKVYLSSFVPVNDGAVWPGTVTSFLKPLPLDDRARPDASHANFRWSAGEELLRQTAGLGPRPDQRRVYHAPALEASAGDPASLAPLAPGDRVARRRLLAPTTKPGAEASALERDLWLGLGVPFVAGDEASQDAARRTANHLLAATYDVKSATVDGVGPTEYLLGDVFHSDPLVLGAPANVRYFADDVDGYRDFARRHENRRKVLLVGTNEGMLHAFDAGVAGLERLETAAGGSFDEVRFGDGSGREIFAFVPRPMLSELRERATSSRHDWGVDGSPRAADVFIDPVYAERPDPGDREWRTVVVGGFRRGAPGYYALDVTRPDALKRATVGLPARQAYLPASAGVVPGCHDTLGGGDLGCDDELPYPAPLWEFSDRVWDATLGTWTALDEDGVGGADLGDSWSTPNLGRVRVCTGTRCVPSADPARPDDLEDRHVVVFGGGLPASKGDWGAVGNWIYMVDVESGETLYKRRVDGSVPGEPAAVDTDGDGYLDRIYFGTTAGYLYRVDLAETTADGSPRPLPGLADVEVRDAAGRLHSVRRVPRLGDDGAPVWVPRRIFDATAPAAGEPAPVRRPIFHRPSVLFVAALGKYALSFGTGDREDLWRPDPAAGRFYTLVDDSDAPGVTLPMSEDGLRRVGLGEANVDLADPGLGAGDFLVDRTVPGDRGWYLALDPGERLSADPFTLSGVSFFVTFSPRSLSASGECNRQGDSRVFAVNTTNANGVLRDAEKNRVRFVERRSFVGSPFTEQAQTRNPGADVEGTADDPALGQHLEAVEEELKTLFPEGCEFGNYRIDVKTMTAETGVVFVAPIPVCIIEKNWKEFSY